MGIPSDTAPRGAHHQRLAGHAIVYGLGTIAARLAGFVLLPIYTRIIPSEELGVLWMMYTVGGLLAAVFAMGMPSAIVRFFYRQHTPAERDEMLATATAVVFGVSLTIGAVVFATREWWSNVLTGDPAHARLLVVILISVILEAGVVAPFALLRAQERSLHFALLSLVRFVVAIVLGIVFVVHLRLGAYGALLGLAVTNGLVFVALLPGVLSHLRHLKRSPWVRPMVRFGFPLMLATLGSFFFEGVDLWLLRVFRDLDDVGQFGAVSKIARIQRILVIQPFLLAWPATMWSLEGRAQRSSVYARTLTYLLVVSTFIALGMSLFRQELVSLVAGPSFLPGAAVLPWLAFGLVFGASHYVLNTGVSLVNRTEFITTSMGIAVVLNVGLDLWLIPIHGMMGAAVATFVAQLGMAVVMWVFSHRLHPIPYEWTRVGALGLLVVTLLGAGALGEMAGAGVGLAIRVGALLAYPPLVLGPWFMDPSERAVIRSLPGKLLRRLSGVTHQ